MGTIEKALVEAGADEIHKTYKDGVCVAISFRLDIKRPGLGDVPMYFKLPAQVEACFELLWAEVKRPRAQAGSKPSTAQNIRQQAERTAWKIISDWVLIQISMINLQQAEPLQIFLPYAYNRETKQTFFEHLQTTNYTALLTTTES